MKENRIAYKSKNMIVPKPSKQYTGKTGKIMKERIEECPTCKKRIKFKSSNRKTCGKNSCLHEIHKTETRECVICHKDFLAVPRSETKTCNPKCTVKLSKRTRRENEMLEATNFINPNK